LARTFDRQRISLSFRFLLVLPFLVSGLSATLERFFFFRGFLKRLPITELSFFNGAFVVTV